MRINVYVDGESHFIRTEKAIQQKFDQTTRLDDMVSADEASFAGYRYPDDRRPFIRSDRRLHFCWDIAHAAVCIPPSQRIQSAVYFTVFNGDEEGFHNAKVSLRQKGFEPQVIRELETLANQRAHALQTGNVIEKPKGLDIALAVRVLEDAYRNIYDLCVLFTSDVDYLPLIEAVQRLGKKAVIAGYKNGLGRHSRLEYVPDQFIDLTEHVQRKYIRSK
jgi:uncharacterized LabA/DUF88 family protein